MTTEQAQDAVLHSARIARNVVLARGEGATVWDTDGNAYLDLLSANMGPAMVGYGHPAVAKAVAEQFTTLSSTRILFDNVSQIEYCARLSDVSPFDRAKTYLCPGGGEANEAALKLCMLIAGRTGIAHLAGAYHGQSVGTMGLCGMPGLRGRVPPPFRLPSYRQLIPGHGYRPWDGGTVSWQESLAAWESDMEDRCDVAALMIEPIQAVAGHVLYEAEFIHEIKRICRRFNILIVCDEVQTGVGRCGAWWASTIFDLEPDIITIGKGAGGGFPFGAVIADSALIDDQVEQAPWHLLTAQGHPLQAAAGSAVLDVIETEDLIVRSATLGETATAAVNEMATRYAVIGDVRCPGLFIGVDLVEDRDSREPATEACADAWNYAMSIGLITEFAGVGGNVMKFKPPLTTTDSELATMLERCQDVIRYIDERTTG